MSSATGKKKLHFLITAGGTREYIDPVRFISNASSGKMGYALAQAAKAAGHNVTLISASAMQPAIGVEFVGVDSAAQMFDAVRRFFPKSDCVVMAAAVADYTPVKKSKVKIKKAKSKFTIRLKPTADILGWTAKHRKKGQYIVGFALEDKNLLTNAAKKLEQKNLDMIIANTPEAIGDNEIIVHIKTGSQPWKKLPRSDKNAAARRIVAVIEEQLKQKVKQPR